MNRLVESENYNCCFVQNAPLPLAQLSNTERKVLDSLVSIYSAYHSQHLHRRNSEFVSLLNSDKRYAEMQKVYPAIALAHWYKNQPTDKSNLASLIDCNKLLGDSTVAFTSQDIENLLKISTDTFIVEYPSGIKGLSTVGGNVMKNVSTAIEAPLSVNQAGITDSVILHNKMVEQGNTVYFNGGAVKSKGADIYPRILTPGRPNSIAGDTLIIKANIFNGGDKETGSFKTCFYYKLKGTDNFMKAGDTIISNLPAYGNVVVKKRYVLPTGGTYYVKVSADEKYQVYEANENNNEETDSIVIKQHILEVTITNPTAGAQTLRSRVKLSGSATDNNFGSITGYNLVWTSDKDGNLGWGDSIVIDTLSAGVHIISLTAINPSGKRKTTNVTIEAYEPGKPIVKITSPVKNSNVPVAATFKFTALANDFSDGKLNNCTWWSDKEGLLGTGSSITAVLTQPGQHKIKVKAVNSLKAEAFDSITVNAVEGFPKLKVTRPHIQSQH